MDGVDQRRDQASVIVKAREDAEASIRKYKDEIEKILQRSQQNSLSRLSNTSTPVHQRRLEAREGSRDVHSTAKTQSRNPFARLSQKWNTSSDHRHRSSSSGRGDSFSDKNIKSFLQAVLCGIVVGLLMIYARLKYPEWKKLAWLNKGIECDHVNLETCKGTLNIVNGVFQELSRKTGRMVCEGLGADAQLMNKIELETFLLTKRLLGRYTIKERVDELLTLILMNPHWNIRTLNIRKVPLSLNSTKEAANVSNFVYYLYTDLATKPFLCRLEIAFWKIATLSATMLSAIILLATFTYVLKNIKERKKAFNRDCYDMIDNITDLLQKQKQDSFNDSSVQPYLALVHIHDTLIPVSKRDHLEKVWDRAREVIAKSESRVRQENQLVDGEEYVVWRWIGRLPESSRPATDVEDL